MRSYNRSPASWTPSQVYLLSVAMRSGARLIDIAATLNRARGEDDQVTAADCDAASWALLGRTPEEACEWLFQHRERLAA